MNEKKTSDTISNKISFISLHSNVSNVDHSNIKPVCKENNRSLHTRNKRSLEISSERKQYGSTKLKWSKDCLLLEYDDGNRPNSKSQSDNNKTETEPKRNLEESTSQPNVDQTLQQSDIFEDMTVSSSEILNNETICYKFNDLIANASLICNQMNMYCISTTVDTIRKMNDEHWGSVREVYEKLKLQEITHTELSVLVCNILKKIYGEAEIVKILKQYDSDLNKAVLIFGEYVLSRYNDAYVGVKSEKQAKSFVHNNRSKYLLPNRKIYLNKEKSMNFDCKQVEGKKTKRKCCACEELSNRKQNLEGNLKQINQNSPKFQTPPVRSVSCFKTNLIGLKTQLLKSNVTNSPVVPNISKNKASPCQDLSDNYQINRYKFDKTVLSYSDGDVNLNENNLLTNESNENLNVKPSCSELPRKKSMDILTMLMKNKGCDKKARSNLTIRPEKDLSTQALGNGSQVNIIQNCSAMSAKLKRCISCIPHAIKTFLPNLILIIIFSLCKDQFDHTNLYCAATDWFKSKIRNVLIGALRCIEN